VIVAQHGAALEYDLMTRTRYLLRDAGGALTESALLAFVRYLPPDSALKQEMNPDNEWLTGVHGDMLLAAIYDQLSAFQYAYLKSHGANPKRPKPLPRPGVKSNVRKVGKGAIPIADFDKWYYGGD
jgi:hypothetical protein